MRFKPLALMLLFVAMGHGVGLAQTVEEEKKAVKEYVPPPEILADTQELAAATNTIIELTNKFREAQGLPPVTTQPQLAAAAEYFADFMATAYKYGHSADGKKPAERAKKYGYDYCIVSENIAYQFSSVGFSPEEVAEKFETGWENSPDHRKNMLDADVTDMGVAVFQSQQTGYYFAVQMFGRPKSLAIEFTMFNRTGKLLVYESRDRRMSLPPDYNRVHYLCRPTEIKLLNVIEAEPEKTEVLAKFKPAAKSIYTITSSHGKLVVSVQEQKP